MPEAGRLPSERSGGIVDRSIARAQGWRHEVWSEPPETELGAIRFLAGFGNQRASHLLFWMSSGPAKICQGARSVAPAGDFLDGRNRLSGQRSSSSRVARQFRD